MKLALNCWHSWSTWWRMGAVIDPKLGVTIQAIDAEKKTVSFVDPAGVIYTRHLQ